MQLIAFLYTLVVSYTNILLTWDVMEVEYLPLSNAIYSFSVKRMSDGEIVVSKTNVNYC